MNESDFDIDDVDDSFDDIVSETKQSRFLAKEHIGKPDSKVDLTILKAGRMMVDFNDGQGPHMETIIFWKEEGWKPFIVRPTNAALIAQILGTRNPREWAGCRIGLWYRPDVTMAGKVTGGIRAIHPSQKKNGGKLRKRTQLPTQREIRPPAEQLEPESDESII
jgi:hypothetical protein